MGGARHAQNRVETVPERDKPSSGPPEIRSDKLNPQLTRDGRCRAPGTPTLPVGHSCQCPAGYERAMESQRVPAWVEEMRCKEVGGQLKSRFGETKEKCKAQMGKSSLAPHRLGLRRNQPLSPPSHCSNGRRKWPKRNGRPCKKTLLILRSQDTKTPHAMLHWQKGKRNYNRRQYVPQPTRLSKKKKVYM